ncbi:hypothetical protein PG984_005659 [Apiospora sp. TS-2023a]
MAHVYPKFHVWGSIRLDSSIATEGYAGYPIFLFPTLKDPLPLIIPPLILEVLDHGVVEVDNEIPVGDVEQTRRDHPMLVEAGVAGVDEVLEQGLHLLPPVRKVVAGDVGLQVSPCHVEIVGVAPQRVDVVLGDVPRHVEEPEVGRPDISGRNQRVEQRLSLKRIKLVYDPINHLEDEPITRIFLMEAELEIQSVMVAVKAVVAVAHEGLMLQDAKRVCIEKAKAYQMQLLVGHDRRNRGLEAFDHSLDDPVGPRMEVDICDLTDPESAVPDDQL